MHDVLTTESAELFVLYSARLFLFVLCGRIVPSSAIRTL